jgi:hypothetical protein
MFCGLAAAAGAAAEAGASNGRIEATCVGAGALEGVEAEAEGALFISFPLPAAADAEEEEEEALARAAAVAFMSSSSSSLALACARNFSAGMPYTTVKVLNSAKILSCHPPPPPPPPPPHQLSVCLFHHFPSTASIDHSNTPTPTYFGFFVFRLHKRLHNILRAIDHARGLPPTHHTTPHHTLSNSAPLACLCQAKPAHPPHARRT